MIILLLALGFRVAKEYQRVVVFRLGRVLGSERGPGPFVIIPLVDRTEYVDLRTKTVDIPPQDVITNDNVPISVNAVLYYNICEPIKTVTKVENYKMAIAQAAQTTLRNVIGQHELDTLLTKRTMINEKLQKIIDELSDPWGIKVISVETKDVVVPKDMQRAMAKEAEAEREKRARIIKAEGELQAARNLMNASQMIEKNPSILELRRMQMVTEVGQENNTTTVIMLPSEFISFSRSLKKVIDMKDALGAGKRRKPDVVFEPVKEG